METARTKTSASARTRSVAFVGLTIAIMAVREAALKAAGQPGTWVAVE